MLRPSEPGREIAASYREVKAISGPGYAETAQLALFDEHYGENDQDNRKDRDHGRPPRRPDPRRSGLFSEHDQGVLQTALHLHLMMRMRQGRTGRSGGDQFIVRQVPQAADSGDHTLAGYLGLLRIDLLAPLNAVSPPFTDARHVLIVPTARALEAGYARERQRVGDGDSLQGRFLASLARRTTGEGCSVLPPGSYRQTHGLDAGSRLRWRPVDRRRPSHAPSGRWGTEQQSRNGKLRTPPFLHRKSLNRNSWRFWQI